jgi:hypothetical protein
MSNIDLNNNPIFYDYATGEPPTLEREHIIPPLPQTPPIFYDYATGEPPTLEREHIIPPLPQTPPIFNNIDWANSNLMRYPSRDSSNPPEKVEQSAGRYPKRLKRRKSLKRKSNRRKSLKRKSNRRKSTKKKSSKRLSRKRR